MLNTYARSKSYRQGAVYLETEPHLRHTLNTELGTCLHTLKQYARIVKANRCNHFTAYLMWTNEEDKVLAANYHKLPIRRLCDLLPNRTPNAILRRASVLKLTKKRTGARVLWTFKEDNTLFDHYQRETIEHLQKLLPRRSRGAILRRATTLGLIRREESQHTKPRN